MALLVYALFSYVGDFAVDACLPELADQLFLFCINTDDGQTACNKLFLLCRDVFELFVPVRAPQSALLFLVCLQGETHFSEQPSNRITGGLMSFHGKLLTQLPQAAPNPLLLGHGVACDFVSEHPLQYRDDGWVFFLRQLSPSSRSPYWIVLTADPVTTLRAL